MEENEIEKIKNIGYLSAKHESGNKNYSAVNMRYDKYTDTYIMNDTTDSGGPSYGKYQFASNSGLIDFMNYLPKIDKKSYDILQSVGGVDAARKGKKEFVDAWLDLSKTSHFQEAQERIMYEMYFKPLEKFIPEIETAPYGFKGAWVSTSVHFGPTKTKSIYKEVIYNLQQQNKPLTLENEVRELYNVKRKREAIRTPRFNAEEKDALYLLNN